MDNHNLLIPLLREEFQSLNKNVQGLSIRLARMEERLLRAYDAETHVEVVKSGLNELDRRIVKIAGINGDNGQLSTLQKTVNENKKKLESLMLSRAALYGYMLAAGGTAAALAKLLL